MAPTSSLTVDHPRPEEPQSAECVVISGWAFCASSRTVTAVEVRRDGVRIGDAVRPVRRPDVEQALAMTSDQLLGFTIALRFAHEDVAGRRMDLDIYGVSAGPGCEHHLGNTSVLISEQRLDARHYYESLLAADATLLLHRSDIYTSGPSSAVADPTCLGLLRQRLVEASTVLDIGCGVGAYGRELAACGYQWFGLEVDEDDCAELTRQGLPHSRIEPGPIPFEDLSYDHVIAIEVLEHIEQPGLFVAELARLARTSVVISVPNLEAVPMYQTLGVVPWHLLEGDHRNFFTRSNLRALLADHFSEIDIMPYGQLPVSTPEGFTVYNHLLATCRP